MKKATLFLAVVVAWTTITLVSCQQQGNKSSNGFKTTESGLQYKFYQKGNDTTAPHIGQYMDVVMTYGTEDTTLFDSRNLPELQKMQIPMIASVFQGDIYEGFKMMHVGDSASFTMPADSVWKKLFRMHTSPPGMDSIKYITFNIKLNEVMSAEEMRSRKEAEQKMAEEKEKTDRAQYMAKNYPDAKPTESGLYFIRTQKGHGPKPEKGQKVKVNYTGKLLDGTVFDSSVERGQPIEFTIGKGQVIPGWDQGIAMMKKGEKAVLVIPSSLAYGAGRGKIPPYATLVFDVELVDISDK